MPFTDYAFINLDLSSDTTETHEFLTEVQIGLDGSEYRKPLRQGARLLVDVAYNSHNLEVAKVFNQQYNNIRKKWAVPLHFYQQFVGDIAANATTIACEPTFGDIRTGSFVWVSEKQIAEVASVDATSITLTAPLIAENDAFILPIKTGIIIGDIGRSTGTSYAISTMQIHCDDDIELPDVTLPQFNGFPLLLDDNEMSGETVVASFTTDQEIIDGDLGLIESISYYSKTRHRRTWSRVLDGQQAIYDHKRLIHTLKGRNQAFYMPTGEMNIIVKSTGLIGTQFDVQNDEIGDRTRFTVLSNGTWTTHTITNKLVLTSATTRLTVTPSIGVSASAIQRISWLGLCRLDSDAIKYDYEHIYLAKCTIPILEIAP